MSQSSRKSITEEQWREAADAYELGEKHAVEIAFELAVSSATISREFKRRGCRKACRVAETVVELEASLDAKARRENRRREAEEAVAWERTAALDKMIGDMVRNLIAADRAGQLSSSASAVVKISKVLGVRPLP